MTLHFPYDRHYTNPFRHPQAVLKNYNKIYAIPLQSPINQLFDGGLRCCQLSSEPWKNCLHHNIKSSESPFITIFSALDSLSPLHSTLLQLARQKPAPVDSSHG